MQLRIGVNLGDVVVQGDNLLGDGVNVAARLQALADPGGIYLSGPVIDQIDGKLDLKFDNLGEQEVKNITKPVRVYRWAGSTVAPAEKPASLPLPDGPSVAVLPFENKSGDPDQSYFSDGLTENIIAGLTRFREILVIGVKSILVVREQAPDLRGIGRALGVAHIVEGSVRKAGDRI